MTIVVVDAGTSSVRAVAVADDGAVIAEEREEVLPASPAGGLVEVDASAMARAALSVADRIIATVGSATAIGITDQRATTIAWDSRTGEPCGPGLGWQDLRTVGRCLELQSEGIRVAPNATATKAEWLLAHADLPAEHIRIGTVDAWLAWVLSDGAVHVTDASNASATGLVDPATGTWSGDLLERLGIPVACLPDIVDTMGTVGAASMLPGSPPIAAMVGDQQAALVGQGCLRAGDAKITFGTGAMLDVLVGVEPGPTPRHGTFPMVGWRLAGATTWIREAVMLSAGTSVEWLRDGLGLIDSAADSDIVAASVADAAGVVFVPSLSGLGTPVWDHGARGALFGLTRGATRAHVVRAVLEGVAHRGADLVDAAEADTGTAIDVVRIDGGMSANGVFVQALADATGRRVEVSAQREATALGAGFLAGVAAGVWTDLDEAATTVAPAATVDPRASLDRDRFREARDRAVGWIPELSALDL